MSLSSAGRSEHRSPNPLAGSEGHFEAGETEEKGKEREGKEK